MSSTINCIFKDTDRPALFTPHRGRPICVPERVLPFLEAEEDRNLGRHLASEPLDDVKSRYDLFAGVLKRLVDEFTEKRQDIVTPVDKTTLKFYVQDILRRYRKLLEDETSPVLRNHRDPFIQSELRKDLAEDLKSMKQTFGEPIKVTIPEEVDADSIMVPQYEDAALASTAA